VTSHVENNRPPPHQGGFAQAGSDRPRLAVVLPLANEEDNVRRLVSDIAAHLHADDRLLCVLDNVSKDGTRGLVEEIARDDERVELVWAPENRCVVDAYVRGYNEALDRGAEWILEMDGGYSHRPEEIPRFLDAMAAGAEFVGGSRFCSSGAHAGSRVRRFVSRSGTVLTNLWVGTEMTDMTSGFECFTADALREVLSTGVNSRFHFFQTEIRARMHSRNWREVPISYFNDKPGIGTAPIKDALKNLYALRSRVRAWRAMER
jgi:dolichol-phosphate mannosyltransferase